MSLCLAYRDASFTRINLVNSVSRVHVILCVRVFTPGPVPHAGQQLIQHPLSPASQTHESPWEDAQSRLLSDKSQCVAMHKKEVHRHRLLLLSEGFRSTEEQFDAGADFYVLRACNGRDTFKVISRGLLPKQMKALTRTPLLLLHIKVKREYLANQSPYQSRG